MYCAHCGSPLEPSANFCPSCGTKKAVSHHTSSTSPDNHAVRNNPSSREFEQEAFISSASWGASLNWIYFAFNRSAKYSLVSLLLAFIPIVNIISFIVFVMNGRKLAWEDGKWVNFDDFKAKQQSWDKGAKWYWGIVVSIFVLALVLPIIAGLIGNNGSTNGSTSSSGSTSNIESTATGLSQVAKVGDYEIKILSLEKVDDVKLGAVQTPHCKEPDNAKMYYCTLSPNFQMYAATMSIKNNNVSDFRFVKDWIKTANSEGFPELPEKYRTLYNPLDFVIVPAGGEKTVLYIFPLEAGRTKFQILVSPYSNASAAFNLQVPK